MKLFKIFLWLFLIALTSSLILAMASDRIGEHKSSTFGKAYADFKASWGGEIGIILPKFIRKKKAEEKVWDAKSGNYVPTQTFLDTVLTPDSIQLSANLDYKEQSFSWLNFNAFEASNEEIYVIQNSTKETFPLYLNLQSLLFVDVLLSGASLYTDFVLEIHNKNKVLTDIRFNEPALIWSDFKPGESLEVRLKYKVKGIDVFRYLTSEYRNSIIKKLNAKIIVNSDEFELYRFGLSHRIVKENGKTIVSFNLENFTTTEDIGISFLQANQYLDRVESLVARSPLACIVFILVIFVFSQVQKIRFNYLHYLFLVSILVFYYLYVTYLIRFIGIWPTFLISGVLTGIMFYVYAPRVFGKDFAYKIILPSLGSLTVLLSAVFLLPIFRGLLFITIMFVFFVVIMVAIARSKVDDWPIFED
ncbi:hypothetical protein CH373_05990 [Leptospira perolatii]|uniref:Cell envelope integrity protein CreD n=1 Tax=Leptospira perolatii TaxID=2023191 RepID=A0A2M9ZQU9_9LEPT|nr:hypothetical protein [Leptospira perolatii]PJZ68362.1 hypothetical protein CH360_16415 [Leptospira perolatii]PJZ74442.1 hypothetical protein CH373_05990 [Leptospira perolatii]